MENKPESAKPKSEGNIPIEKSSDYYMKKFYDQISNKSSIESASFSDLIISLDKIIVEYRSSLNHLNNALQFKLNHISETSLEEKEIKDKILYLKNYKDNLKKCYNEIYHLIFTKSILIQQNDIREKLLKNKFFEKTSAILKQLSDKKIKKHLMPKTISRLISLIKKFDKILEDPKNFKPFKLY